MTDTVNMPSGNPSRKVVGATVGAGLGGAAAGLVNGLLDDLVYTHSDLPGYISTFVVVAIPGAVAFLGGYVTRRSAAEVNPPA